MLIQKYVFALTLVLVAADDDLGPELLSVIWVAFLATILGWAVFLYIKLGKIDQQ